MVVERGLVTGVEKEGWAEVTVRREPGCPHCGAMVSCGAFSSSPGKSVRALNKAGAKTGDAVSIVHGSGSLLGAAITYLIPTVGLVLGATAGAHWRASLGMDENLAAIVLGALGVALGFAIALLLSRKITANKDLIPVITRVETEEHLASCALRASQGPDADA